MGVAPFPWKSKPWLGGGEWRGWEEKEVRFRSSVANWPIFGQLDTEKAEKLDASFPPLILFKSR